MKLSGKKHEVKKHEVNNFIFEVNSNYLPIKTHGRGGLLGSGGYGVVGSFMNTDTKESVAIKKIRDVFCDEVIALRILREINILRNVQHEYVIGLKDVMITSPKKSFHDIYLVYENMDTDLQQIIKSRQKLSQHHAKFFMVQLLEGIRYLHSVNVVHRDLKPANILINANCDLKKCDFGLARICKGQEESSPMTEYVVTRWYRAPELLVSNDSYDAAIDMWSIGCIFAETLGRKPLFCSYSPLDQLKRIIDFVGSPSESDLDFIKNEKSVEYIKGLPYSKGERLEDLFPEADPLGLDLLGRMLVLNPRKRITASEALRHPYMADAYNPNGCLPPQRPLDNIDVEANAGDSCLRDLIWREMMYFHNV